MSYQPGTANLPAIQQNSIYDLVLRMTDTFRAVSVNNPTSVFTSPCHGFEANSRIVFFNPNASADYSVVTASAIESFTQSCKLEFNKIYYVASDGLTEETFKISETENGTPVTLGGTADNNTYLVARPLNITGYVFDADICEATTASRIQIATFTCSTLDAADGTFRMKLEPSVTTALTPGDYVYDLSVTPPNGARFYAMRGSISVQLTRSR